MLGEIAANVLGEIATVATILAVAVPAVTWGVRRWRNWRAKRHVGPILFVSLDDDEE